MMKTLHKNFHRQFNGVMVWVELAYNDTDVSILQWIWDTVHEINKNLDFINSWITTVQTGIV